MEEMQPMSKDASFLIAERAIDVTFDNIPDDVINTAKRSIPDTLGVIIGASGITPGIKEVVMLIRDSGGKQESSILGFGGRVPALMAAFANGAMAHCMDYDDI